MELNFHINSIAINLKSKQEKTMNLKPLADRVIVKPAAAEEKTKGGLYIPDTGKEKPQYGEVVAVGPGKIADNGQLLELQVKVGQKVLYLSLIHISEPTRPY